MAPGLLTGQCVWRVRYDSRSARGASSQRRLLRWRVHVRCCSSSMTGDWPIRSVRSPREKPGASRDKFSRYRSDSVVGKINASDGRPIRVDEETASLIEFSSCCYSLSNGAFDITSGVLRRAWRFDGSDRLPSAEQVSRLREHIGFEKLTWSSPELTVPQGMEIDFGGLGKEYAVDRAMAQVRRKRRGLC